MLASFSSNPESHLQLGRDGAVPPLIGLANWDDENCRCLAIAALRRLAEYSENRYQIVAKGVLPALAMAGRSRELEIQREVSACLCNLSLNDQNKVAIAKSGALKPLCDLCKSEDVDVAGQALWWRCKYCCKC